MKKHGIVDSSKKNNEEASIIIERDRLANILEGINVGTWEWNVQTGENIINKRWAEIVGYTIEEITNHINAWEYLLHPEDLEKATKVINHVSKRERDYYVIEFRMKHKDGHWVWVQSNGKVISWTDEGKPLWICGSHTDVTDRKMAEEELLKITAFQKTLIDNIAAGIVIIDAQTHVIEEINQEAANAIGALESQIIGKTCENFLCPAPESKCEAMKPNQVLDNTKSVMLTVDGVKVPILKSVKRIDINGREKLLETFVDITNLKKAEEEILYLSYNDVLTGLYNRRYLEQAFSKLNEAKQLPISIIMADINGLKLINDIYGHFEGDRLLILAATIFKKICRKEDLIARWGGDEFIIFLPETSQKEAEEICNKIVDECRNVNVNGIGLSISLGHGVKNSIEEDIRQVIKKAEDVMYKQKMLENHSFRNNILNSMIATLHAKSKESEEHVERLKKECKKIGVKLGLSQIELNDLELLTLLHDIGKISISDAILNKSERLNESEWLEMKKHSETGYRIAQSYPELKQIAQYILSHHEKWDGTGYPRQLKGKDIPLLSRIIAVIDAYDAMTNDRVYRKALTKELAIKELIKHSGTQFDPSIVEAFIEELDK